MRKRKQLFFLICLVTLFAVPSGIGLFAQDKGAAAADDKQRADIISIATLKKFGSLSEPAVRFLHDKHTKALEKSEVWKEKGCNTCHVNDPAKKVMSLKFMRLDDASRDAVRDIYHDNCIKCHTNLAASGQKSGPLDGQCRGCHLKDPEAVSAWKPITVDKATHFRHARDFDKSELKCGTCHHRFDDAAGKLVPETKEENVSGACLYCHKENDVLQPGKKPAEIRSLRRAAHDECVTCHLDRSLKEKDKLTGPVTCEGCHSAVGQAKIKENNAKLTKGEDIRFKRKQPDATLVSVGDLELKPEAKPADLTLLGPVAFNHKLHEEKAETCVACHHAALESCAKDCHSLSGKTKNFSGVKLDRAMHAVTSAQSCVGCHAKTQSELKDCAGCHDFMKKGLSAGDAACKQCHLSAADTDASLLLKARQGLDAKASAEMAEAMLKSRKPVTSTVKTDDIPEKVLIGSLAKEYEASEFPHRKIVLALQEKIKDNTLTQFFHSDEAAMCRQCHHNSPASLKPPKCGYCHPAAFDAAHPAKPGLKAAYHGECMGCHTAMAIDGKVVEKTPGAKPVPLATDCEGCHKAKKN